MKGAIDNANTLAYGVPIGPELISCGTPVTVTRIADDIWTIVATNACLREGAVDVNFRPIIDSGDGFLGKDASFSATLTVD